MQNRSPIEDLFFHFVEKLDDIRTRADGNAALRELRDDYGLAHITYLGINIPSLTDRSRRDKDLYYVSTYNDAWCEHYVQSRFVDIDPVIKSGLSGIMPFDWRGLRQDQPDLRRFFGEAGEHGVGKNGLSFPIRGAHGETAFFSINSDETGEDWEKLKQKCIRDFQIFAYHFHTQVLSAEGVQFERANLSRQEIESLKWAAAGKTNWETGQIMHIAESTVKFYLENARVKLGAVNKTQAVARAIAARLF